MVNVTLVLGTARDDRKSERVARYLEHLFDTQKETTLTFVDVKDHITSPQTIPPWGTGGVGEKPTSWQQIATDTDAFVFILPEYNHGYPGEWKLLIDLLYDEYKGKRAYIVGVSKGIFGGVRVADHVKPVLVALGLVVQKAALYVGNVESALAADGTLKDAALRGRATKFVDTVCQKA